MSLIPARTRPRSITPVFLLVMLSMLAYFTAVGIDHARRSPASWRVRSGWRPGGRGRDRAFALTAVLLRPLAGRLRRRGAGELLIIFGGISVGLSILAYSLTESLTCTHLLETRHRVGEAVLLRRSRERDQRPRSRRAPGRGLELLLAGSVRRPGHRADLRRDDPRSHSSYEWVWVFAGVSALFAGAVGFIVPETRPPDAGQTPGRLVHKAALLPGDRACDEHLGAGNVQLVRGAVRAAISG